MTLSPGNAEKRPQDHYNTDRDQQGHDGESRL
jgi:hypothetical protein